MLNVLTPALERRTERPVMVWLHGGGFSTGSGSQPILDGTSLAQTRDVVVVTINHRLNVFGSTYLGDVAGSDFALSGCVGMLDIVAALEWVRDNIDRFGGDPNLVTIFGQSGGGEKSATLMAMPDANGLFHRAIIESGAMLRVTAPDDAIVRRNCCSPSWADAEPGARAAERSVAQLLAADAAVQQNHVARARHDGKLADGRWQGSAESSVGPGRANALSRYSAADRIRPNRGDPLRPAHPGNARPRRSRTQERAATRVGGDRST